MKPTDDDALTAGVCMLKAQADANMHRQQMLNQLMAGLHPQPQVEVDPEDEARLRSRHLKLDEIATKLHDESERGAWLMTRIPAPLSLSDITRFREHVAPQGPTKLNIFGAYTEGFRHESSSGPRAPTTDLLQNVLVQSTNWSTTTGELRVEHRVSNFDSDVRAFVGFPFKPSVSVGFINVRPYLEFEVNGFVDVQASHDWPLGQYQAAAHAFGIISVTSERSEGGDPRGQSVVTRAFSASQVGGAGGGIFANGLLTVMDGFALDTPIFNTRKYMIWVGCAGTAFSDIIPRKATSQVHAILDFRIPWVVVEERPI